MNWFKRVFIFTICLCFIPFTACEKDNPKIEDETPNYTLDSYEFENIYTNTSDIRELEIYDIDDPSASNIEEYIINKEIGKRNYLKIEVESEVEVVGWIKYSNPNNSSETNEEKFFIPYGDKEFTTFLDAFRGGAFGNFEKRIDSISFQSVDSTKSGHIMLKKVGISDRTYNVKEMMYIEDGTAKFGTALDYGGCIKYFERTDINVIEYIDNSGNTRIDYDIDPESIPDDKLISEHVNVINIYDLGREVQPSYYLNVKEENGWKPKTAYKYDSITGRAEYNPIQCGAVGDVEKGLVVNPQIIDYSYSSDKIWVKSKGQDWMFVNDQAQGYIESTYTFGRDGVLIVDNSYVDFYQFVHLENTEARSQETPATYVSYVFNRYYCETKNRIINDPTVGAIDSKVKVVVQDPTQTIDTSVSHYYAIKSQFMRNSCDWMAFINDQYFGVGIFTPEADLYMGSHGLQASKYSEAQNHKYSKDHFSFGENELTPTYAALNYSYMNTAFLRKMVEFIPFKYSYALYIGTVDEMREMFSLTKKDGLTNENLTMGENTWPRN